MLRDTGRWLVSHSSHDDAEARGRLLRLLRFLVGRRVDRQLARARSGVNFPATNLKLTTVSRSGLGIGVLGSGVVRFIAALASAVSRK